jgi:hypothetical protein
MPEIGVVIKNEKLANWLVGPSVDWRYGKYAMKKHPNSFIFVESYEGLHLWAIDPDAHRSK